MNKYPDFWSTFLGSTPLGATLAFLIWGMIAAAFSFGVNVINRDPASAATPVKTSWRFMLLDNILRLIVNLLAIPIAIRILLLFMPVAYMVVASIATGICIDRLALWLKNLGILAGDKFTKGLRDKLQSNDPIVKPKE